MAAKRQARVGGVKGTPGRTCRDDALAVVAADSVRPQPGKGAPIYGSWHALVAVGCGGGRREANRRALPQILIPYVFSKSRTRARTLIDLDQGLDS